jgi:hypothetical protein
MSLERLHAHRADLSAAHRFEQRRRIRPVRLVATNIGTHILRWKERDPDAAALQPPSPVMRGRTGLHDDVRDAMREKEALRLSAAEPRQRAIASVSGAPSSASPMAPPPPDAGATGLEATGVELIGGELTGAGAE